MSTVVLEHLQNTNSASPDLTIDSSGNIGISTVTPSSKLTVSGSQTIANNEAFWAANLTEASDYRVGLRITPTRGGQTKGMSLGAIGANSGTAIQGYDTSDNSANTLLLNPLGGGVSIGSSGSSGPLLVNSGENSAYTATGYNDTPIVTLKSPNSVNNYTGIRYSNSNGSYEWYVGSHQHGANEADFVIQGYDRGVLGYKEQMRIHESGEITASYQPAFSAIGFSAHRYMSAWHDVDLNNWNFVDQSLANAYNNSNGRFTAPVAGMYFFIYTSMFQNPSTNDFHNLLKINGTGKVYSNNHAGGGSTNGHNWNDTTVNAAFYLQAGDYVTCASTGNNSSTCFLYGSSPTTRYCNFSGWLIG